MTNTDGRSANRDPVVRVGGARIRAQARSVATVIRIDGRIDWRNVDEIFDDLRRFLVLGSPLVVDLGDADVVASEIVGGFSSFDMECVLASVPWLLAADAQSRVGRLLDAEEDDAGLPVVESVAVAIELFAESIRGRRHFVTGVVQPRLCG